MRSEMFDERSIESLLGVVRRYEAAIQMGINTGQVVMAIFHHGPHRFVRKPELNARIKSSAWGPCILTADAELATHIVPNVRYYAWIDSISISAADDRRLSLRRSSMVIWAWALGSLRSIRTPRSVGSLTPKAERALTYVASHREAFETHLATLLSGYHLVSQLRFSF